MHGTAGQRASPANANPLVLITDQHRLSNTVTQQNVPLWRKQGSNRPLTLHILKSPRQLRLDFNLAHMSCLTCLNYVCARQTCVCVWFSVCLSECLHVVEVVEWCKSLWFWTFPACNSAPACPQGGPCVHGKVTAPFQTAFSGRVGNTENSNARLTWGTPGPNTTGAVTSHAPRNAVFLSPSVRNLLRFMTQLPALEK